MKAANKHIKSTSICAKRKNKQIFYYVTLMNIVCALLIWHFSIVLVPKPSPNNTFVISQEEPKQLPISNQSFTHKFRKNLLFLKTHKTASSTVQNILIRFGMKHSLNFLMPKRDNYLGYISPIVDSNLDEEAKPLDGKYNLFVHHSRYHSNIKKYLYEDAIQVTILRSPPELFESAYYFFRLDLYYRLSLQKFINLLPRTNRSLFVRRKRLKNGYNQMSYDLGMADSVFESETQIRNYIEFLDNEFNLVMIKEHFDASLVLLADLMGWPLDYVSYLPLMQREQSKKYKLSKLDRYKLTQLNQADTLLYDHFLEKFQKQIIKYGEARMMDDILKLQKINDELIQKCVKANENKGFRRTLNYVLKNQDDWTCVHATKSELKLTMEIQRLQKQNLKPIRKLHEFLHQRKNFSRINIRSAKINPNSIVGNS